MSRRNYPVRFHVEFTGDSPSLCWEGDVDALSRDQAIILGTARARDEGTLFTNESRVRVTQTERD